MGVGGWNILKEKKIVKHTLEKTKYSCKESTQTKEFQYLEKNSSANFHGEKNLAWTKFSPSPLPLKRPMALNVLEITLYVWINGGPLVL